MEHQQAFERLTDVMERYLAMASKRLPDDVYLRLLQLSEQETSPMQKIIYEAYFENLQQAQALNRPCCQDTGILHYYLKVGAAFPYMSIVAESLREATARATASAPLRPNAVNFFDERNTGDNTGERVPWIHWDIVPERDGLEVTTYFAGGGCCLPGRAKVFKPSDGYAAIMPYVFETVTELGVNACPPLIVGVGLGHNIENAALLSKKAYLRPIGTHHAHPLGEKLERDLLSGLNGLGIGAQGLPGNAVALAVHIESSARHTATFAVAVNTACYMHRRGTLRFDRDLNCEVLSYRGVKL